MVFSGHRSQCSVRADYVTENHPPSSSYPSLSWVLPMPWALMSDAVNKHYDISNVTATLMSFVVFIAFAVFSVPGGFFATRIAKKNLLLLGLGLTAVAVLIPSLYLPTFPIWLAGIFMLGIGLTAIAIVFPAPGFAYLLAISLNSGRTPLQT
jgi:MFS family permease